MRTDDMISFLIKAKKETYAGSGCQTKSSRPDSHDFIYSEGDYMYYDTYLGSEKFSGEEALWIKNTPYWSMNYFGRAVGENFRFDFLKEALRNVPTDKPFRGPESYIKGNYVYKCDVNGAFDWFQGYETITCNGHVIYECYFHGGHIK